MNGLLRFLVPRIPRREWPGVMRMTLVGMFLGGVYGVLHDQVTYSISPEYFTRLKFDQFAYANPGMGSARWFAGVVGFLATWWVGGLVVWVLCRFSLLKWDRISPRRILFRAFGIVFLASVLFAAGGWLWGVRRARIGYEEGWRDLMASLGVVDEVSFMTVCYIHNASYLGGVLGTGLASLYLRRRGRWHDPTKNLRKSPL